ncbi:hypothetical protein LCGC14_1421260 [marine sediment metagenome]|uniref:Uncharacterized protein n=1 Tax=marine sediment metagenome TaxID=412755 RepID=A0A0F9JRU6_9ZZZZ
MATTLVKDGVKIIMDRAYNDDGSTSFTAPTEFKVGQDQTTPTTSDTDLTNAVPISNGTVNDDGDNQLTGSSGGDNTTDNITTFKPGAGISDDTSQNLIANNTNATKIWTIADLSANGTNITGTSRASIWLYILDSTALAKFKSSGTAIELRLGSDPSNYFFKTWTAADLAIGWNWLNTGTTAVNALSENGTVAGNIDTFIIEITTNNSTDTFIAGDVLYDLLRTWVAGDLTKTVTSTTIDNTALTVQIRSDLASTEANGFVIDSHGNFNTDSSALMEGLEEFVDESKTNTDEFIFTTQNQFVINNVT